MDQKTPDQPDRNSAILAERNSLLLTALLIELLQYDKEARSRMEMTLNMLSVENRKHPVDSNELLDAGILAARKFIGDIPTFAGKLPESARRYPQAL